VLNSFNTFIRHLAANGWISLSLLKQLLFLLFLVAVS